VVDAVPGTATSDGGRSALSRLKARIDRGDVPDLIIVATGINDVHRVRRVQPGVDHIRDPNARRLAYRQILTGFVSTFMSYVDGLPTNPTVVWLTIAKANPNVVTDDVFNEVLLQEQQRRNAASDPGASALSILDVAKEMVDHPEFYVSDGIHLTKKGQEFRVRCHLALLDEQASLDLSRVLTCPSQGPSSAVAADSP
jgi:lysophospholipase L1-like esterase